MVYYLSMDIIDVSEYIDLCLVKKGKISHAELARLTNQLPQSIYKKFKNRTFKISELKKIADILDADLDIRFIDRKSGKAII